MEGFKYANAVLSCILTEGSVLGSRSEGSTFVQNIGTYAANCMVTCVLMLRMSDVTKECNGPLLSCHSRAAYNRCKTDFHVASVFCGDE
jgi:hypothetical protein